MDNQQSAIIRIHVSTQLQWVRLIEQLKANRDLTLIYSPSIFTIIVKFRKP